MVQGDIPIDKHLESLPNKIQIEHNVKTFRRHLFLCHVSFCKNVTSLSIVEIWPFLKVAI